MSRFPFLELLMRRLFYTLLMTLFVYASFTDAHADDETSEKIYSRGSDNYIEELAPSVTWMPPPTDIENSVAKTEAEMRVYGERFAGSNVSFDMLPIPGGCFLMGSPESEANRREDEGPQVEVDIEPFWMARCETTWNEFNEFIQDSPEIRRDLVGQRDTETVYDRLCEQTHALTGPSLTTPYVDPSAGMRKGDCPTTCMSHHIARTYCLWLTARTGRYYRLPTEAEWEYACRAGTATAYSFGDDPEQLEDYGWFFDNAEDGYQKVGTKRPNPWGLHDMHGNVSEWCLDQYYADRYEKLGEGPISAFDACVLPTSRYPCVVRGGSWYDLRESCRSSSRSNEDGTAPSSPDFNSHLPEPDMIDWEMDAIYLGFRVVRPLQLPTEEECARYEQGIVEGCRKWRIIEEADPVDEEEKVEDILYPISDEDGEVRRLRPPTEWMPPPTDVGNSVADTEEEMRPYTEPLYGDEVSFDMLPIPGGRFLMGSPESEAEHREDEGPQVEIKVEPFWMARCETTWNEYAEFQEVMTVRRRDLDWREATIYDRLSDDVEAYACGSMTVYTDMTFGMGKDGYPAICMSQKAARAYCLWLTARTGRYYRLPTEAEWEYACRAGTTTAYSFGDDPEQLKKYAWYYDNAEDGYEKVGTKRPNPWGLHDMHGNVSEWCMDQYAEDRYSQLGEGPIDALSAYVIPTTRYPCVVRGGSWYDLRESCRSASRSNEDGTAPSSLEWNQQDPQFPQSIDWLTDAVYVGFRVVRPLRLPSEEESARHVAGVAEGVHGYYDELHRKE
jgi:formylglycine-generating enzyme required for sulfatase activity